MEFSGVKRRKPRLVDNQKNACYPHSLQFYLQPPSENISLIEFENLAIDRVKLLKSVENLGVSHMKGTEQYQSKLEAELRKLKFSYRENLEDEYEPRRRDHISHFILRLAYCQSEDLRRWFIQQEMDLLRFRFSILPKDKVQSFLKDSHLQFEAISDGEKTLREQDLIASSPSLSGAQLDLESVYKIPFADALDLFRGRKVYLENGFAYVPLRDIVAIILNDFRTKLSKALASFLHWSRLQHPGERREDFFRSDRFTFYQILPALHAPAAQSPAGESPPSSRGPHAVWPLPEGHRLDLGTGFAVLEARICQRKDGSGQV
uniref:DNA primase large subunit n=1 Tax=Camelus bactrianus TaxID=9837 RepID=A0A9W3FRT8_CAMBA|nr:DNA primase large subunit isoform X2 [Camelus bactrianus]